MATITTEIRGELLVAMDHFKLLAKQLIDKLIAETDQPQKLEIISKSIALDSTDPTAYFRRGQGKYALRDYLGAIEDLTKAIEIYPEFYDAIYQRAMAYESIRNFEKAGIDYKRAELIKYK